MSSTKKKPLSSPAEPRAEIDSGTYLESDERMWATATVRTDTVIRLLRLILKHRKLLFLGLMAAVAGTVATLLEPRLFGYAIDDAILPRRMDHLRVLTLIYLGLTCVRGIAGIKQ